MDTGDSSMDTANGAGGPGPGPGAGTGAGAGPGMMATVVANAASLTLVKAETSEHLATVVANAASLTLVKAETPERLAGTSTTPASVTRPIGTGRSLFAGIASSNKASKPDDWLATNSPGSPQDTPQSHLVVYTTPQQQLNDTQQQQPPLAHSSPLAHQQPPTSNNGYASPMSTSSYDPYSPNSKIGRDELSQPGSLNGYGSGGGGGGGNGGGSSGGGGGSSGGSGGEGCDARKKKGPTPRQQEELCLVCGDRASGYHYNALTCEGCKGFFRRSITKNAVYQCKYGNNCEIDMYMRRKCQECRLKKCLTVGMRPECVVPEYQCAVKRKEKKAQKEKDKPNSTTMNGSPGGQVGGGVGSVGGGVGGVGDPMCVKIEPAEAESLSMSGSSGILTPVSPYGCVKPITDDQEELIHRVVYFQNEFEQPSEEDLKRITSQPTEGEDPSDYGFRHITEITILTVQLIVEFSKRLPGFDTLMREDQIALLKACSSEVMMLRMARKYDVQTDSIIFANNQPYTRDNYNVAGMGENIEDLLRFCRQMYAMKVNNAEYALLTAIVIFSERPNVAEGWKVEKIQEIYLEALKAYVDNRRRPKSGTIFAKLLSVLTELRTLGNQNSEMCFSLQCKNKKLPNFLAEIWDVVP